MSDPYKLKLKKELLAVTFLEGNFFDSTKTGYFSIYKPRIKDNYLSEITFYDENFKTLFEKNYPNALVDSSPFIFDYDNDGIDEILLTISKEHKITFCLLDFNSDVQEKFLNFHLDASKNTASVNIYFDKAQLDDDPEMETVFSINANGSDYSIQAGIYSLDIDDDRSYWRYPTAEYIMQLKVIDDGMIVYSSGGVRGKLAYSNNCFFYKPQNKFRPIVTSGKSGCRDARLDRTSDDFSIDSLAVIAALDSKGNLIWKNVIGHKNIWVSFEETEYLGRKKIICLVRNKDSIKEYPNELMYLDISTGQIIRELKIDDGLKEHLFEFNDLYCISSIDNLYFINKELEIEKIFNYGYKVRLTLPFVYEGELFISATGIENTFIYDSEFDVMSRDQSQFAQRYLKMSKMLVLDSNIGHGNPYLSVYSLDKKYIWNRFTGTTYLIIFLGLSVIGIILLAVWAFTYRTQNRKILRQKKEISDQKTELENTVAKLIHTEKLAVLGTVAGGVAHELNSPLGAIVNSVERLTRNNPELLEDTNFNLIKKASQRSKIIAEKFLMSTRGLENEIRECPVKEVLQDWLDLYKKQFNLLGIELKVDNERDARVKISYTEMSQIFTNLLFNSRDSVLKSDYDKIISITVKRKNGNIEITISDSGGGFPEKVLDMPFTAFFTTKDAGKGTGLGLWVVKKIIDKNEGEIELSNDENGAVIRVSLPAIDNFTNID